MKKILAFILTATILISALAFSASVSAETENPTANPSSFNADFSNKDLWTGNNLSVEKNNEIYDEDVVSFTGIKDLINTQESYFGTGRGGKYTSWHNPTGYITANGSYDFGDKAEATFAIYTDWSNTNKILKNEDYYVTIGKFKIAICDFQTRITVYYDGKEIDGKSIGDTSYKTSITRTYKAHIEKGNITVESEAIRYTSAFNNFDSLDGVQVSLGINETWQISSGYFKSLQIDKYVPNATEFTADFTSAENWESDNETVLGYLNYDDNGVWKDGKNKFGTNAGWENAAGSITTKQSFDFGNVFDLNFSLYTNWRNGNKNGNNEDFYITVGDFRLAICDFQTRLVLSYKGNIIPLEGDNDNDYVTPRNYHYEVHIEKGKISISSDLLSYTSSFSDFEPVDNAKVSITINETHHIYKEHFYDFSVIGKAPSKGDVNGDGAVDENDLASLRKYLLGIESLQNPNNGDVNSDGKIDICDLVSLNNIITKK